MTFCEHHWHSAARQITPAINTVSMKKEKTEVIGSTLTNTCTSGRSTMKQLEVNQLCNKPHS
jgi:hypothetical protein